MFIKDRIENAKSKFSVKGVLEASKNIQPFVRDFIRLDLLNDLINKTEKSNVIALCTMTNDNLKVICKTLKIDTKELNNKEKLIEAILGA